MSYYRVMTEFEDYSKKNIKLSEESWNHIQSSHAEISLEMINNTVRFPFEVRESIQTNSSLLYYSIKLKIENKTRYVCVVVKETLAGERYIQTAMTTSYLKSGRIVYRQED